jgi:IS5 family transposase
MLIVGYCFGIRSERRLCEEVHLNLAYRWFCRLGLEGNVPDHSTFSKTRHGRFREADLLRELFETVVRRCMSEGLVGGEGFAVDASQILADASRQRDLGKDRDLAPEANRAVAEYLAVLDDAAFGAATPVEPKSISPVDPAARWTAAKGGAAVYAYCTNYLIDMDHAVIVDVEATTAIRQAEVTAAKRMIERTQDRFGLWPERLMGDTGYGSGPMLSWLVHERGIEPHIPVFDNSKRSDGTFSRDDFVYNHKRDRYRCPAGKDLRHGRRAYKTPRSGVTKDGLLIYRASKSDCGICPLKPQCTPKEPARKIKRSIHEGARDMARDIAKSDVYPISVNQRKKVEMLFAHLKRILRLDRLRLRGPLGARDEFHLAAVAQNLRKLAKLFPVKAAIPAI